MATIETGETARTATVSLTERAADKVRALMAQEPAGEAEVLRVAIQGGGCGGFEYALGFDRGATGEDAEFDCFGVRVVVDPASARYLKGATVDFVESLKESGFKVDNPNASGSCGCGHSFHVAEEGDEHERGAGCSH
jgi:iron-sulfur cluster assembly protein